jgi:hypothetical protein
MTAWARILAARPLARPIRRGYPRETSPAGGFAEAVKHDTIGVNVPNDRPFPIHFYMRKPRDLQAVWTAGRGISLQIAQAGSSTSGNYVGGGIPFELEVLQVMVMTAQVQVDFSLAQERFPVLYQNRGVAMVPVGEYRMVRKNSRVQRRRRLGKFISKP